MLGQAVKAVVVLRDGADETLSALLAWCRQRLEVHMVPKEIVLAPTLPKTSSGKVRKRELR